jgi:hypothetical protein
MEKLMKKVVKKSVAVLLAIVIAHSPAVLAEVNPETEQKFLEAIKSRDTGNLAKAIKALEAILATEPNLGRARAELAVAYYRLRYFDKAREAAKVALNDPKIPDEVKLSISLFLAEIDAQQIAYQQSQKRASQERHEYTGVLTVGAGNDDNVNVGPSGGTITINDTTLNFTPDTLPREDNFTIINARVNHTYTMQERLNIGSKPVKGLWRSTAGFYEKRYPTESDYKLRVFTLSTGPAFLSQTNWRASIPLQVDYIRLGGEALGYYTSISPTYTLVSKNTELTFNPLWQDRTYQQTSNEGIEGDYYGLSVDVVHKFTPKLTARAGMARYVGDFMDSHSGFEENALFAGVNYGAWNNGTVYFNARSTNKQYQAVHPIYNAEREDNLERFTLGALHSFKDGVLADWSINLKVTQTNSQSNIVAFDYDREVYQIEFTHGF